jgi:hypothetical protein
MMRGFHFITGITGSNNNSPHRLVPSDPMEFLGPIVVHLREEFGSHSVLKRFHTSPSQPFVSHDFNNLPITAVLSRR